jgi:hypothetical protein
VVSVDAAEGGGSEADERAAFEIAGCLAVDGLGAVSAFAISAGPRLACQLTHRDVLAEDGGNPVEGALLGPEAEAARDGGTASLGSGLLRADQASGGSGLAPSVGESSSPLSAPQTSLPQSLWCT